MSKIPIYNSASSNIEAFKNKVNKAATNDIKKEYTNKETGETKVASEVTNEEIGDLLNAALENDGKISTDEIDAINSNYKFDIKEVGIDKANTFTFKMTQKSQPNGKTYNQKTNVTRSSKASHQQVMISQKGKMDGLLKSSSRSQKDYGVKGSDITTTLGIDNPPKNDLDKGALASTFSMLEMRRGYGAINKSLLKPSSDGLFKLDNNKLKSSSKSLDEKKNLILFNPDMSHGEKLTSLVKIGVSKPSEFLKDNRGLVKNRISQRAQLNFEALGGKGPMPSQYLSATGDGSSTMGLGKVQELGSGYFMYDQVENTVGGTSKNDFKVFTPEGKDFEMKLAAYGFDGDGPASKVSVKIGGEEISLEIEKQSNGSGQLKLAPGQKLPKGVTIDSKNNTVKLSKDYSSQQVEVTIESPEAVEGRNGRAMIDERQVHVSTNGNLQIGGSEEMNFDFPNLYANNRTAIEDKSSFKSKTSDDQANFAKLVRQQDFPITIEANGSKAFERMDVGDRPSASKQRAITANYDNTANEFSIVGSASISPGSGTYREIDVPPFAQGIIKPGETDVSNNTLSLFRAINAYVEFVDNADPATKSSVKNKTVNFKLDPEVRAELPADLVSILDNGISYNQMKQMAE